MFVTKNTKYWNRPVQYDLIDRMISGDAERVGKYKFPQLKEEKCIPTNDVLPINYLMSSDSIDKTWFHSFCDDSQFIRHWNNFDKYLNYFQKAKGIIASDFSLYRDFDEELQIWNCMRNRSLAYAMQKNGVNVIPTAGFGGENTWSWCFDGLPKNSTVAITTNGIHKDKEAKRLFVGGVDAMVKTIKPYAIVVCGSYPIWLNSKYPQIRIIPISSYSQQWNNRRCG